MFQEWHEADESLAVVLRRAGYGGAHGKKLIGLLVAFALSVGIGISTSPAALASDTVSPASESSSPAEDATVTSSETSTDSTSTDATSSDATSSDATSTDSTSTDSTSTDSTSSDSTSTDSTSTDSTSTDSTSPSISLVEVLGVPSVGQRLTASVSVSGTPPPTLSYVWQRGNAISGPYFDITGATSDSYVLTAFDRRQYIRVNATASNSEGEVTASSASVFVTNGSFGIAANGEAVTDRGHQW